MAFTRNISRKPVKIDLRNQAPLIRMLYPSQFDGLIRRADRANVHAVFNALDNQRISLYLGGGVVEKVLDSEKKGDYSDIDFLAYYSVIHPNPSSVIHPYATRNSKGEFILDFEGRKFIKRQTLKQLYMNNLGITNFLFVPIPNIFGTQSPIDISFLSTDLY